MTFLGRAIGSFKPETRSHETTSSNHHNGAQTGHLFHRGDVHRLLKLINECGHLGVAGDPRHKLSLYRAMEFAFPMLSKANQLWTDFIGCPIPAMEDEGLKTQFQDFFDTFRVQGERLSELKEGRGMNTYTAQLSSNTLTNGESFRHLIQEDGEPITGARLHDSARFDFWRTGAGNRWELRYHPEFEGMLLIQEKNPLFDTFSFSDKPEYLWGIPMTYWGEFMAEQLLIMLTSRTDSYRRLGNPPSFTVIGYDLPNTDMVHSADFAHFLFAQATEAATKVKDIYAQTLAKSNRDGRPADAVMMAPGKLTLDTKMFGEGAPGIVGFDPDWKNIGRQLAISAGPPPTWLGFPAAAGMNSNMHQEEKSVFMSEVGERRRTLEAEVKEIMRQFLVSISAPPQVIANPESYLLEWEAPDTSDRKLIAEAEKVEAETVEKEFQTFVTMSTAIGDPGKGMEIANDYAEELGETAWILKEPVAVVPDIDDEPIQE